MVRFLVLLLALASRIASANPFTDGQPAATPASPIQGLLPSSPFLSEILAIQRQIHDAMTAQITALRDGTSLMPLWLLLGISFAYGVFHVLAPGHGKMIVSTYFIGNRARWRDAVWAGFIMAVGHTITAIGIVTGLYLILGVSQLQVLADASYFELIGYGLICTIGLWLSYRAIRGKGAGCAHCGHDHALGHRHDHEHAHGHEHQHACGHEHSHDNLHDTAHQHDHQHTPGCCHHDHPHDHSHQHGDDHGHHHHAHHDHVHHDHVHHDHSHAHSPVPLTRNRHAFSLFAATSLVPCSGSMIILLFTLAHQILWAGVLAVLAIALGMWLTLTIIALAAIILHRNLAGGEAVQKPWQAKMQRALGIGAALLVMLTGGVLFSGALMSLLAAQP